MFSVHHKSLFSFIEIMSKNELFETTESFCFALDESTLAVESGAKYLSDCGLSGPKRGSFNLGLALTLLGTNRGGFQGVSIDLLKYHQVPPCPVTLRLACYHP
jgi:hypothetical protein